MERVDTFDHLFLQVKREIAFLSDNISTAEQIQQPSDTSVMSKSDNQDEKKLSELSRVAKALNTECSIEAVLKEIKKLQKIDRKNDKFNEIVDLNEALIAENTLLTNQLLV